MQKVAYSRGMAKIKWYAAAAGFLRNFPDDRFACHWHYMQNARNAETLATESSHYLSILTCLCPYG